MTQKSSLSQQLKQRQFLTQAQVRLARMLELTAPELDEAVKREVEENPALEADEDKPETQKTDDGSEFTETEEQLRKADYANPDDIPYYRLHVNNAAKDDDAVPFLPADNTSSLYDILMSQLRQKNVNSDILAAAQYIIGNLDSNGYLRRTPQGIADDIVFNLGVDLGLNVVEQALDAVHDLEPFGVGASDLRQCLLIQLFHKPKSQARNDAIRILEEAYDAFTMKHSHRIIQRLGLSEERLEAAINLILSLNPKPGASLGGGVGSKAAPIIPDFIVDVNDGEITVTLNNRIPELRVSESFERAVKLMRENADKRKANKEKGKANGNEFLTMRYRDACDFIKLLRQRQHTLFSVMTAIVEAQRDYFMTEDVHRLHPLGIKEIASTTGYDISVISRATAGKYASTPWGVLPLRFFFSGSVSEDSVEGEEFTAKAVQDLLKQLIDNEDKRHPLSDEKLRALIEEKGYPVARRTVAKYRDLLKIPVARLRKEL